MRACLVPVALDCAGKSTLTAPTEPWTSRLGSLAVAALHGCSHEAAASTPRQGAPGGTGEGGRREERQLLTPQRGVEMKRGLRTNF